MTIPVKKRNGTKYALLMILAAAISYLFFVCAILMENDYLLFLGLFFSMVFVVDGLLFVFLLVFGKIV